MEGLLAPGKEGPPSLLSHSVIAAGSWYGVGGKMRARAACRLKYCFPCWYGGYGEHFEQRQWDSEAPCLRRTQTDIFPPLLPACSRTQAPSRIRAPKPSYLTLIARLPGGRGQFL